MPLKRWGPTSAAEIDQFERTHRITLPASYREYMRSRGGGGPDPDCFVDDLRGLSLFVALVFGLDDEDMAKQLFPFPPPSESGLLPVATNAGGDYYLIALDSGEVFYWDHEHDDVVIDRNNLLWLAPSFPALMESLVYPPGEGPTEVDEIERLGASGTVGDLEAFVERRGLQAQNAGGRTVAEEAARYGNLPVVRKSLELGASMRNLLHYAAQGDNLELVKYLVSRGADVNGLNAAGESPLDRAMVAETYALLASMGATHARRAKPPHLS